MSSANSLISKKYQIILADPPWRFGDKVKGSRSGGVFDSIEDYHYPTMATPEIETLPIVTLAETDSALFIWTTDSHLPDCLSVIKAWGFEYKTVAFYWLKTAKWNILPRTNLGKWTQKNIEMCLFATRGRMAQFLKDRSVRQLIEYPRTGHSRKPPETKERIVQMFGDLLRIELFSRHQSEGWDCWGNDVKSDIELTAIPPVKKPLTVTFDRPIEIDGVSSWVNGDGSPFKVGE